MISKDDIVYDNIGRKVQYVSELDDGHLVSPIHHVREFIYPDDCEETTMAFGYEVVEKVFKDPPIQIFDEKIEQKKNQIKALEKRISSLSMEKHSLNTQMKDLTSHETEVLKRVKRIKNLENIEDYLDGKMTHYFEPSRYGTMKIGEISEWQDSNDRYFPKKLRMVSLSATFSDKERYNHPEGYQWSVNHYYDGSGSYNEVYLFKSEQDAIDGAKRFFKESITKADVSSYNIYYSAAVNLLSLGGELPENYKEFFNKEKNRREEKQKESNEKAREQRLKKFQELKEEFESVKKDSNQ